MTVFKACDKNLLQEIIGVLESIGNIWTSCVYVWQSIVYK